MITDEKKNAHILFHFLNIARFAKLRMSKTKVIEAAHFRFCFSTRSIEP